MSEQKIPIPSMIYNAAVGGHVTSSQQIIDEDYNIEQKDVNKEVLGVPYNAITPNGMGKIVLKKNDNFKQVVEAQTDGNTIFVIKYDFTLTDNVTVPANCVLEFDGGSVSGNGTGKDTITGNNTEIKSGLGRIFNSIKLSGSYTNKELCISCWGIKEGTEQLTISENSAILSDYVIPSFENIGCTLFVPKGTFCYSTPIIVSGNFDIKCIGTLSYYGNVESTAITIGIANVYTYHKKFSIKLTYGNDIRNYYIQTQSEYSVPENYGLKIINANNCIINIDVVSGFANDVIFVGDGTGFVQNTIYITIISGYSNKYLILKATNDGWVNENLFISGQFQTFRNSVLNSQNTAIELNGVDTTHPLNNNVFIKPSIEYIYNGVSFTNAKNNTFVALRNEEVTNTISSLNNSQDNLILYASNTSGTGGLFPNNYKGNSAFNITDINKGLLFPLVDEKICKFQKDNTQYAEVASSSYVCRYNDNPGVKSYLGPVFYGRIFDVTKCHNYNINVSNPSSNARFYIGILNDNFELQDITLSDYLYNDNLIKENNFFKTTSNMYTFDVSFKSSAKYVFIGVGAEAESYSILARGTYMSSPLVELPDSPLNKIDFVPAVNINVPIGYKLFITGTLNKFIWWNGTAWVDATGTPV